MREEAREAGRLVTHQLRIGPGLELPEDVVTRRMAVLAMSGAGKSNAAVVLAEELHAAGIPWVAIDPKGDWWGVRSARDGKGGGLAVPVFGGRHGDVPLESAAGRLMGEMIAEERLGCVLDVSDFDTRQQQFRFLADLAIALLKNNRDPLHLFLEEADDYLPQRAAEKGELPRCLGAWQRLVKRGRFNGLGCTIISQRPAAVSKDVLNMAEALIVLRTVAKHDRKAIEDWIETHAGAHDLVRTLPELNDGEAWVWSPQWLKITKRVQIRRRETFDSGATPRTAAGARRPPPTLADIDLAKVRTRMAETLERVKADDPKILRGKIAELEKQLKTERAKPAAAAAPAERIEVPMIADADLALLARLNAQIGDLIERAREIEASVSGISMRLPAKEALGLRYAGSPVMPRERIMRSPAQMKVFTNGIAPSANGEGLGSGERATLIALAQNSAEGCDRAQLAILTGYKRSTRDKYLQLLTGRGFAEQSDGRIFATQAGIDALGEDYEALPTGARLLEYWRHRLPDGERRVLDAAVSRHPSSAPRDWISEQTEFKRSTRDKYIQHLSARRLVESSGRDGVRASDLLFD